MLGSRDGRKDDVPGRWLIWAWSEDGTRAGLLQGTQLLLGDFPANEDVFRGMCSTRVIMLMMRRG